MHAGEQQLHLNAAMHVTTIPGSFLSLWTITFKNQFLGTEYGLAGIY